MLLHFFGRVGKWDVGTSNAAGLKIHPHRLCCSSAEHTETLVDVVPASGMSTVSVLTLPT